MIILEPKEKPAVIFAEVPPVGRCAKQSASVNIAEPVINVMNDTSFAPWRVRPRYKISIIRVHPKILC